MLTVCMTAIFYIIVAWSCVKTASTAAGYLGCAIDLLDLEKVR